MLYKRDPSRYEVAAIRWLGRLCLERPGTTITDLRLALAAFDRLPEESEQAGAEARRPAGRSKRRPDGLYALAGRWTVVDRPLGALARPAIQRTMELGKAAAHLRVQKPSYRPD